MKNLYKISQIAKFFNLSKQTLRYYDKIGLLTPKVIDECTGYRYYDLEQFDKLYLIMDLRKMALSLNEIKEYCDKKNVKQLEQILKNSKVNIEERLKELSNIKGNIDFYLEKIKLTRSAYSHSTFEVRKIKERYAYFINVNLEIRDIDKYAEIVCESYLNSDAIESGSEPGHIVLTMGRKNIMSQEFKVYNGIGLLLNNSNKNISNVKPISQDLYAVTYHVGAYSKIQNTYKNLFRFITENKYGIKGDAVEVSVTDIAYTDNIDEYVTAIQIPVTKE